MAKVDGVSGVHNRIPQSSLLPEGVKTGEQRPVGRHPDELKAEELKTRASMAKQGAKKTEYTAVIISEGSQRKIKLLEKTWWDDGKGRKLRKQRVACIMKGGRVLSGRWPEGVPKP